MNRSPLALVFALTAFCLPSMAHATLIGDSIESCLKNPGQCQSSFSAGLWTASGAVVADPGVEYSRLLGPEILSADFTATTLTIARDAQSGFGGAQLEWDFRGLDYGASISNVTLIGQTGSMPLLGIVFGPDSIRITTDGFGTTGGILHSLTFSVAVPEPGVGLLMLASVFSAAALVRMRLG